MLNYSQLLSSRQYLALDLLEGLCARAREVTQSAFERGESLSSEELFNLIMIDMACKADELQDLQGLFAGAGVATANVLEELQAMTPAEGVLEEPQATTPAESVASPPMCSLPELQYLPEGHWHTY